jgi:hypothetical protein
MLSRRIAHARLPWRHAHPQRARVSMSTKSNFTRSSRLLLGAFTSMTLRLYADQKQ